MPTYKLTYFDFRARGELCRLIFHVAGVEYEDERIIRAEWSKWKPRKSCAERLRGTFDQTEKECL